jgi:zinc protease
MKRYNLQFAHAATMTRRNGRVSIGYHSIMPNSLLRIAVALALAGPALAQQPRTPAPSLSAKLTVDPKVKVGTLPNGLRYYIRKNAKPEKRAELRLVVNAGSILENPDQLGLAHFIEHMAFNGTTHFQKNDLVKYLQSIGVRFGADLNAHTDFDETVYILPIPTDTARLVEKAFQILEDWAHGLTFDSTEVVNERGVVHEEWRSGRGAGERMLQQWLPVAFKGSLYAQRLPIGTEASIMAATPSRLRPFYRDWYRPDLMAVVAVGDFDPTRIEQLIKHHFSGLTKPQTPRRRILATVPDNAAPLVAIASDKEATSSEVQVTFKMPVDTTKTVGDYRRDLMEQLYMSMLNARFGEISQKPDAPFLGAGASKGTFIARTKAGFTMGAEVQDGGIARGLEALLTEARRVDQFGFLESELARAKTNTLRGYERAYAERDKTQSAGLAEEYVRNYLEAEAVPGIAKEYELAQQLLPTVSLKDVNTLASKWITDENRVIIAESPQKEGLKVPTEGELLAVFDRAAKTPITAYTENVSGEALIDNLPPRGRVVDERRVASVDVTERKLSNGARVLVKPTDFKADEIRFAAYSPGGTSLVPDSLYMSASFASQIASLSGVGKFNRIDLGKKLSGKVAGASPSIGETTEGMGGSASPKDLETLFQLIYLEFTAPRLDTAAYQAFEQQVRTYLANRGAEPDEVFSDTVGVTMAQHHFRSRPLTAQTFAEVNPRRAIDIYRDRFADASDFTFLFVGNVNLDTLRAYAERYLATLPSTRRKETWRDVGERPPTGVVERIVRKGTEPKANTLMFFTGPCTYAPQNRFAIRALTELFDIKLTESLREQLGGTYSPSVGGGCSRTPRQSYTIEVQFGSSPDNVEKLTRTTLALIDSLKNQPPAAADVEKVKEQMLRGHEVDVKQNAYWLGNVSARDQAGEDLGGLAGPYDDMIKALTGAQIQAAAKQYFNTANYARFVLLPETKP